MRANSVDALGWLLSPGSIVIAAVRCGLYNTTPNLTIRVLERQHSLHTSSREEVLFRSSAVRYTCCALASLASSIVSQLKTVRCSSNALRESKSKPTLASPRPPSAIVGLFCGYGIDLGRSGSCLYLVTRATYRSCHRSCRATSELVDIGRDLEPRCGFAVPTN
ncbi:hypothetical protein PoB_003899100 [Plakobranchus ocellatus]|uniref:Secreted protein n=1 Tax=Plakobranchus ocellatus TaxID=259542 RepID=A0AAV4AWA0_9GAST|nr:hypothetical protein PoB_003899100 [Plakobranchus ocellatus]